ncbi:LINE-1 retrotransposable element ORF2 protein [Scenedesmus sp. PABB004]|nr:LINE-1 retrotransposable element ORF2 protein [Scenedesmus sp. PABB004]
MTLTLTTAANLVAEGCAQHALPAALAAVVAARGALAALDAQSEREQRQRRRQRWVHGGERPGRAMSSVMRQPKGATFVGGLRAPGSGHVVPPAVTPAARQVVLQAVQQHSQRLEPQQAASLGAPTVTGAEVLAAIAATAPGKAPGLDGLPGELFRAYRAQFSPLLAALYSAIGRAGAVPPSFLDGVAIPILKPGGDGADPGAYRPIQLLNYDYRILAKVLASRLLSVADSVIDTTGTQVVAAQYADDAEPFITSLQGVPHFCGCMNDFAAASGQRLNLTKTKLLPIGLQAAAAGSGGQPHAVHGMPVVHTAAALGMVFDGRGGSDADWETRMTHVRRALRRVSMLPRMSSFGRAFAANAYALATVLYAGQFGGGLTEQHLTDILKWCGGLVDAGLDPEGDLRRPPGIPKACMAAHPREGGMGLLPVREHLHARWAMEGAELITGQGAAGAVPWAAACGELWRVWADRVRPDAGACGDTVWGLMLCDKRLLFDSGRQRLPQPLRSFALGLRALPPLEWLGPGEYDWRAHSWDAPLWGNPLLTALPARAELHARHHRHCLTVSEFDGLPHIGGDELAMRTRHATVCQALARWWQLKVPNTYKEAAWRLTLQAFPTASRMQPGPGMVDYCVYCCPGPPEAPEPAEASGLGGALHPSEAHHFWRCPVAGEVWGEIEKQLKR